MNFDMNVVNKYMHIPRKVHLEALNKKMFFWSFKGIQYYGSLYEKWDPNTIKGFIDAI
jgi:hypothetical protein